MDLLTITTAARRLGVCEQTLRRWDQRGIVAPVRDSAGRRVFFSHDIERIARERAAQEAKR